MSIEPISSRIRDTGLRVGSNGRRDVAGRVITHCLPNEHSSIADEPEFAAN